MFKEAVVLAGGFGTRLSHVLGNVPKPMAPVYGKPFLCYLLERLEHAGAEHIVLATGYLHDVVAQYFGTRYRSLRISYSREEQPLWTGGAIAAASKLIEAEQFLVLNGDTLFDIDMDALCRFHEAHRADVSIALRHVEDTARYGAVTRRDDRITCFAEKAESTGAGQINGGIYAVNRRWIQGLGMPEKFSFEKDVLQAMAPTCRVFGQAFEDYFIDIGIPDDYYRAQKEFAGLFPADRFLFLDRDGVLNKRVVGDYVREWGMWEWLPDAAEAAAALSRHYERTFVVTNQQGISKGLFSLEDAADIHRRMTKDIQQYGGNIDRVYVCPDLQSANSPNRKPAIGMALQARLDYPDVVLSASLMAGDSVSDLQFGWQAGMRCVYLHNNEPVPDKVRDYTDLCFADLAEMNKHIDRL